MTEGKSSGIPCFCGYKEWSLHCLLTKDPLHEHGKKHSLEWTVIMYLTDMKISVVIYQMDSQAMFILTLLIKEAERVKKKAVGKVWIATALQDLSVRLLYRLVDLQHTNVSLSFSIQTNRRTQYDNFKQFLFDLEQFGEAAFHCSNPRPMLSVKIWKRRIEKDTLKDPPQELIERLLSQDTYSIYNAIQAMARTLHAAYSSRSKQTCMEGGSRLAPQRAQLWQIFLFLHHQPIESPLVIIFLIRK
ncbi:hypothetical protein JD844_013521 [Phrynosoma platyrhinos]|uniref:Uncharacterized protein n=1 Tax=Phrynosoma platyrhinos TaxID=52577 RepID=A0ABQ7TLZ1_PHRPL|nr:hypothetical protein JD844_013521 [Phrynosoma platyrhinos]